MNPVLRVGSWEALQALAMPLRMAVFVDEQKVPAEMELDEHDPASVHAVLLDADGSSVATGRLLPVHESSVSGRRRSLGRIGRMAVRCDLRGRGLGAQVLDALLEVSRLRDDDGVLLHAQCSATGFYAGRGFVAHGEPFDEAGIEHVEMLLLFAG